MWSPIDAHNDVHLKGYTPLIISMRFRILKVFKRTLVLSGNLINYQIAKILCQMLWRFKISPNILYMVPEFKKCALEVIHHGDISLLSQLCPLFKHLGAQNIKNLTEYFLFYFKVTKFPMGIWIKCMFLARNMSTVTDQESFVYPNYPNFER